MLLSDLQKKFGIGLTGGIACGKTTVATILQNLGFPLIQADLLSHKASEPGTKGIAQIVEEFGGGVLLEDGTLNRAMMRKIIFNDPQKKKILENIIHPVIEGLLYHELKTKGLFDYPRYWFYESSLLYETGNHVKYYSIWAVTCPYNIQLQRLQKRDHQDPDTAKKIIDSQMDARLKAKKANVVLDTHIPMDQLETKIRLALESLTSCRWRIPR